MPVSRSALIGITGIDGGGESYEGKKKDFKQWLSEIHTGYGYNCYNSSNRSSEGRRGE